LAHASIAEHDDDAREGDIEFFRDDLSERCADACAEIDMTVERADRSVGVDPDKVSKPGSVVADDAGRTTETIRKGAPFRRCAIPPSSLVSLGGVSGSTHRGTKDFA
jgi:hypothetical protein